AQDAETRHRGGFRACAGEDLNLHDPIGSQGPQPCASTNSATSAGLRRRSLDGLLRIRRALGRTTVQPRRIPPELPPRTPDLTRIRGKPPRAETPARSRSP